MIRLRAQAKQFIIAIDQALATFLGLLFFWSDEIWWADETLSSRCYRKNFLLRYRIAEVLINFIFFWEPDHCRNSFEQESLRNHLPQDLRT